MTKNWWQVKDWKVSGKGKRDSCVGFPAQVDWMIVGGVAVKAGNKVQENAGRGCVWRASSWLNMRKWEIFGGWMGRSLCWFWGQQGESLGVYDSFISCTKTIHSPLPPPLVYGVFFIFLTNVTARCLANDMRKNTLGKG